MPSSVRSLLAIAVMSMLSSGTWAHYSMLLLQQPSVSRDQPAIVLYQWGHPYEHELFDAPQPEKVGVVTPAGKRLDLSNSLTKVQVPLADGKNVTAYRVIFTPEQRGDHSVVLTTPPIWMQEEQEFWQDTVKVVQHVVTQNGWDAATGEALELVPLTRPYGLEPGCVFQVQALGEGKPFAGAIAELERYNSHRPKELPPDEQITRRMKADPNGIVTCSLPDPGWWCVTITREVGKKERNGKSFSLRLRATFWVFVENKGGSRADK